MTDSKYTVLTVHEFKAKMCEYMRRMSAGEGEYIVKRYGKPVAVILNARMMELNAEAAKAQAGLKRHMAVLRRHAEQRRLIKARLLSWPLYALREQRLADLRDPEKLPIHLRNIYGNY